MARALRSPFQWWLRPRPIGSDDELPQRQEISRSLRQDSPAICDTRSHSAHARHVRFPLHQGDLDDARGQSCERHPELPRRMLRSADTSAGPMARSHDIEIHLSRDAERSFIQESVKIIQKATRASGSDTIAGASCAARTHCRSRRSWVSIITSTTSAATQLFVAPVNESRSPSCPIPSHLGDIGDISTIAGSPLCLART